MRKMESCDDKFEDTRASVSIEIRPEHVGVPVHSVYYSIQDLNGETRKEEPSSHNSFCKNETEEIQKERTPLLHLRSETRTKVKEISWYNLHDFKTCIFYMFVINCNYYYKVETGRNLWSGFSGYELNFIL